MGSDSTGDNASCFGNLTMNIIIIMRKNPITKDTMDVL